MPWRERDDMDERGGLRRSDRIRHGKAALEQLLHCVFGGAQAVPPYSSSSDIPVIETARLRLRGHTLQDVASSVAMWADPVVTRFIGGVPSTEQQTWMRVLGYLGHWSLMGFGYWALEEKATGLFVGELGFAKFRRDMTPSIREWPEIGWALASAMHGRGYAREALDAALDWGDAHLPGARTVCICNPDNARSLRMAQRAGYRALAAGSYRNEPVNVLARERP
jgi:RimJ/RimL family protein N-acetyltransferase